MIKVGETYQGKTITKISGGWVQYRYESFEGECTVKVFENRWVLPHAIKSTESPSVAVAEAFGNDCPNNSCS